MVRGVAYLALASVGSLPAILAAFVVSATIGIAYGYYPAGKNRIVLSAAAFSCHVLITKLLRDLHGPPMK